MKRQASLGVTALGALIVICLLNIVQPCRASITVWYQEGQAPLHVTTTGTALSANYTGSAAYNPNTLNAPAPPGPAGLPTQFALQLSNTVPPGASIAQSGSFFGFSIEMSVVNQVSKLNSFLFVGFVGSSNHV